MSKVVVLDAGHGLPDPGAVGLVKEYQIAKQLVDKTKPILERHGVKVILTRTSDKSLSTKTDTRDNKNEDLNKRVKIINDSNCDLGVSFHLNAGGGTGYETVCYNNKNPKTIAFHNEVSKFYTSKGIKIRGFVNTKDTHTGGVAIIDRTKPTVVLGEHLFVDTKADADHITDPKFQAELVIAIAKGILSAIGVKYVEPPKPAAPKPAAPAKPTFSVTADGKVSGPFTTTTAASVEALKHLDAGKKSVTINRK